MDNVSSIFDRIRKTTKEKAQRTQIQTDCVNGTKGYEEGRLAYSITSVLNNPAAFASFVQFFESLGKLDCIKLWMEMDALKGISDSEGMRVTTRFIYDRYFGDGNSLQLPSTIWTDVRDRIQSGEMGINVFSAAESFLYNMFQLRYFEEFQSSVFYKKHELEALSAVEGVEIIDIIHCQSLLPTLLELVEEESDEKAIQFVVGVDTWRQQLPSLCPEEAKSDAISFYHKFLSLQAPCQLRLPDSLRSEAESLMSCPNERRALNALMACRGACLLRLHHRYTHILLSSPSYTEHMAELQQLVERGRGERAPLSTPKTIRSNKLAEVDEMGEYRALFDNSLLMSGQSTPAKVKDTILRYMEGSAMREGEMAREAARSIIADVQSMVRAGSSRPSLPTLHNTN